MKSVRLTLLAVVIFLCGLSGQKGIAAQERPLSLSEAIDLALVYNSGIKAAVSDSAAAGLTYQASRVARFPTLSLDARTSYLSNVPEASLGPQTIELGLKENYQADFRLSLPLYAGGRITNAIAAARENRLAESAHLQAEKMSVAYRCRKTYLQLLLADAAVKIADASLKRVHIIEKNVKNMQAGGLADSIDIIEAALAVAKGAKNLDAQKTFFRTILSSLHSLTGLDPETKIFLADTVTPPADTLQPDLAAAVSERPELARLKHVARAAGYSASSIRANYLPTLSGFAGYSLGKPNRDMFNKDWDNYLSVGLTLNWQINTGGQTVRNAAAARQKADAARAAHNELKDVLDLYYRTALGDLKHAYNVIAITGREYELTRHRFRLAEEKQKAGQLTVNRLLEMEAELTAAEQEYRSVIIRYFLSETELLYALGSSKIFGGLQ